MRIIGCDLHAREQSVAMLDTDSGELVEKTLEHDGEELRKFYSGLSRPVVVGIEATGTIAEFSSSTSPVKNATITATHMEIGATHVANSNEKGDFQFVSLEPGKYKLKVSHQEYSELTGIDFWVTRTNLTRLPTVYMFRKNEHSIILCQ